MNLKSIYKKHRRQKQLKAAASHIRISPSAILGENFNLELHAPCDGHEYLTIGEKSMIDSSFVFETGSGQVQIGARVHIGGGTQLIARSGITIGDDVIIAWNCTIYDHNSHSVHWKERQNDVAREWESASRGLSPLTGKDWDVVKTAPIRICDKAWLGFGVTVLKGVTVGEGAVIAAGSVVTRDIPPYTLAGGNPARVIRTLDSD